MPRTGGSSDTDPARRPHGGWRRHTGPPLEPGLRAAFRGCTDSKPGALRAPWPPAGASGRARRGGSPHHGHLWCDAVPGLAGPRSGCEPGSQLGAAPGFRMLHQYGLPRHACGAGCRSCTWRACATRAPAEEGARGGGGKAGAAAHVAPRASSPLGVSPRTSPPPSARRRHGDPRALEPN